MDGKFEPRLRDFYSARKFLTAYSEWRRAKQPGWSIGAWTQHLKLGGTSSLSRILSGERLIGDELAATLIRFFEWNGDDAAYFTKLIEREREFASKIHREEPVLTLRDADVVTFAGHVNEKKLTDSLSKLKLEPIGSAAGVPAAIHVNHYEATSLGAYNESYVCFPVRPVGSGILDVGLFFTGFSCNRADVAKTVRDLGGHEAEVNSIHLHADDSSIVANIGEAAKPYLALKNDPALARPVEERYEMNFYATNRNGLFRARFKIDTMGTEQVFRPGLDEFWPELNPRIHAVLSPLGFQAERWIHHRSLYSEIFLPRAVGSPSTF